MLMAVRRTSRHARLTDKQAGNHIRYNRQLLCVQLESNTSSSIGALALTKRLNRPKRFANFKIVENYGRIVINTHRENE